MHALKLAIFPRTAFSRMCTLMVFCLASWACSAETEAPSETEKPVIEKQANPRVMMETTLGNVTIELFPKKAPASVENFIAYVESGHYDGTIFHRIIPNFMAQGGGYDTKMNKKSTRSPIINESNNGLKNVRTTLSMARTMDPDSATAQFFINFVNNNSLDGSKGRPGYAVFGRVVEGMSVVDSMAVQPQGAQGGVFVNAPNTPIVIEKAYTLTNK